MSVVGFEVENKPRKQLLIVDILLRVFDQAVLETDMGNSVIHARLIKKNYPVSKPTWNNFTEGAAEGKASSLPSSLREGKGGEEDKTISVGMEQQ